MTLERFVSHTAQRRVASHATRHPHLRKGHTAESKKANLETVHSALVASGVPSDDRFHRVLELDASDFVYHETYPDLSSSRSEKFILIEIVLSVGRSVKVKKQIVQQLATEIARKLAISSEDIMVVFIETRWENWSFGGGRFIHV